MKLEKQWNERQMMLAEADRLWNDGHELIAEGEKLIAQGYQLWAESRVLTIKGDKLWESAILETYGNIKFEWVYHGGNCDCHLENGEIYKHNKGD